MEQRRTAQMNRCTSAANPLIDPPQLHLNQLWQLAEARLLMATPAGTDLNSLHYVELRELNLARGWVLLTVPNVGFQAQLQQAPLNRYVREALSSVCRRVMNLAIVVPTREGLPTLEQVLAQEAALPTVTAPAAVHQSRDFNTEPVYDRAERAPGLLLLASVAQTEAPA